MKDRLLKDVLLLMEHDDRLDKSTLNAIEVIIAFEENGLHVLSIKDSEMYVEIKRGSNLDNRQKIKEISKLMNVKMFVKIKER